MRRFLAGSLIGAVVAAVVAGSVYSATSLLYISGTLTSGHTLVATTDGFGAQDSGGSANRLITLTWGPGQNLVTDTLPMGIISTGGAATVSATACAIGSAVNTGTATLDLYYAASGTALSAGQKINTTSCNSATGANTTTVMGVGTAPANSIPAGNVFGVVATGTGWSGGAGSGAVQIAVQQQ
jgi:hypothetical protein